MAMHHATLTGNCRRRRTKGKSAVLSSLPQNQTPQNQLRQHCLLPTFPSEVQISDWSSPNRFRHLGQVHRHFPLRPMGPPHRHHTNCISRHRKMPKCGLHALNNALGMSFLDVEDMTEALCVFLEESRMKVARRNLRTTLQRQVGIQRLSWLMHSA